MGEGRRKGRVVAGVSQAWMKRGHIDAAAAHEAGRFVYIGGQAVVDEASCLVIRDDARGASVRTAFTMPACA